MIKNYSNNAIMAKVRVLYGRRLKNDDYEQLIQKRTVGEIAAYLKNETYFAESMREVNEERVHRGQLENIVRRHNLDIYIRLMRYSRNDNLILQMYVMKNEITQLLKAIRLINAQEMNRYIVSFPAYFSKYMSLDLFSIAACKTYDDLLQSVRNTRYYSTLARFRPHTREQAVDIIACETALLTQFYSAALAYIEKNYRGETRADLKQLLHYQIDFHNISVIYRMKRFFAADPKQIQACLIPIRARLSPSTYKAMLQATDIQAFSREVKKIQFLRHTMLDFSKSTGQISSQFLSIQRQINEKIFRFSHQPVVVVMCFMALLDIEVNDITNIVEGVRYNVSPDEIRSLLAI